MKKRIILHIVALLLCLLMLQSAGLAESDAFNQLFGMLGFGDEDRNAVFTIEGQRYVVELPDHYLEYTPEMGQDSPLLKLTGASVAEMNEYMEALQCVLCAVHEESQHQLWISVKDHSGMFSEYENEVPLDVQRAYYDGVALSRGKYKEYHPQNGKCCFVFENNPSINKGGSSLYVAYFDHKKEISVRWESGNGKQTNVDEMQVILIASSILTEEEFEKETEAANSL